MVLSRGWRETAPLSSAVVEEEGDLGTDLLQPQQPPQQLLSLSKTMALSQAPPVSRLVRSQAVGLPDPKLMTDALQIRLPVGAG